MTDAATAAPAERTSFPELTFERTVDRSLVHRAAVNEVFLTDSMEVGKREWAVAAMLPRSHMLFNDGGNQEYLDPIAIMEITRQVTEYVAHHYVSVPHNQVLIFRDMRVEFTDPDGLRAGPDPARIVVVVNARTSEKLQQHPVTVLIGDRVCGRAGGRWMPLPAHYYDYARERARKKKFAAAPEPADPAPPEMLDPVRVGRILPRNVLLADAVPDKPDSVRFRLVLELTHPVFFDHPVDHVPGMLMLEAARQVTLATLAEHRRTPPDRALIVRCEVNFGNFCELDMPTRCRGTVTATTEDNTGWLRHQVAVTFEQARETLGTIALEVLEPQRR